MKRIWWTGAAGVLAAALAAACGSAEAEKTGAQAPSGGPAAATIPHACSLLPKAEAEAVAGEPLGEPKKGPEAPASADVATASRSGRRSYHASHAHCCDRRGGAARGAAPRDRPGPPPKGLLRECALGGGMTCAVGIVCNLSPRWGQ